MTPNDTSDHACVYVSPSNPRVDIGRCLYVAPWISFGYFVDFILIFLFRYLFFFSFPLDLFSLPLTHDVQEIEPCEAW